MDVMDVRWALKQPCAPAGRWPGPLPRSISDARGDLATMFYLQRARSHNFLIRSWARYHSTNNQSHNIWGKREIPHKILKPRTICKCSNLGWNGRVLTLSFRTLGFQDPKVQNWSNKAENIAWKYINPSQIAIFDPNFKFWKLMK